MATKQETIMALIPMDEPNERSLVYKSKPDSKEYHVIFNAQQRHQWIMQGDHDKTALAITLGKELGKHLIKEVKELLIFFDDELESVKHRPLLYNTFKIFIQEQGRRMMDQMGAMEQAGAQEIFAAVHWSLDVLPSEEHKTFWDWLLGRKK